MEVYSLLYNLCVIEVGIYRIIDKSVSPAWEELASPPQIMKDSLSWTWVLESILDPQDLTRQARHQTWAVWCSVRTSAAWCRPPHLCCWHWWCAHDRWTDHHRRPSSWGVEPRAVCYHQMLWRVEEGSFREDGVIFTVNCFEDSRKIKFGNGYTSRNKSSVLF